MADNNSKNTDEKLHTSLVNLGVFGDTEEELDELLVELDNADGSVNESHDEALDKGDPSNSSEKEIH